MTQRARHSLTSVGNFKTNIDGHTISYTVKRSARARHIRLEVRQDTGLTVIIPRFCHVQEIPDLIERKRSWVLSVLAKYEQARSLAPENGFKNGDILPYLGRNLDVVVRRTNNCANTVILEQNKLIIKVVSENGRFGSLLESWYRTQAWDLIGKKVDEFSAELKLRCNRLIIRGQRTRWGSCSEGGTLSFNWKLVMAPESVIDYVIIHELFHLKEMNHSKKFWGLVAAHCPRWREHKKWLKEHEAELTAKASALKQISCT